MHDPIQIYDARWRVADFDDQQVARLFEATLAYGRLLDAEQIVLTRDARRGAPRVVDIATETALRMGYRVLRWSEPASTPLAYFITMRASDACPGTMGLAITASHNPSEFIGVKFTAPTMEPIGEGCGPLGGLTKIRELYHGDGCWADQDGGELVELDDPTGEYCDFAMQAAAVKPGDLTGVSVLIDAFHGSAGSEVAAGLTRAGAAVMGERLTPDGSFPTGSPNPTSIGKMERPLELAAQHGVDVVIGLDGDGDRAVFGSPRGILSAGYASIPILQAMADGDAALPQLALCDPKVHPPALARWQRLGVKPVLFRNGHSQIAQAMQRLGIPFAAEESGHYYHTLSYGGVTAPTECSLATILLFLKAFKQKPELLDELFESEQAIFVSGEFNYQLADERACHAAVREAVDCLQRQPGADACDESAGMPLEGVLVRSGVGADSDPEQAPWFSSYVRVATNEPGVVRTYISASTADHGRNLEGQLRRLYAAEYDGVVVE